MTGKRSRYTIDSVSEEIDECIGHILLARKKEGSAYDQFTDTIYEMKEKDNDAWSVYIKTRANYRYKKDEKYYHKCVRKRMKLEKQNRLLNIRLKKLKNTLLSTNSHKLFVINHINVVDIDVLNIIKILMFTLLKEHPSYYL